MEISHIPQKISCSTCSTLVLVWRFKYEREYFMDHIVADSGKYQQASLTDYTAADDGKLHKDQLNFDEDC